jgi:hypothetical protein
MYIFFQFADNKKKNNLLTMAASTINEKIFNQKIKSFKNFFITPFIKKLFQLFIAVTFSELTVTYSRR